MRFDLRALIFWEWPVAGLLLVALALDGAAASEAGQDDPWWTVAGPLAVCALALVALRLPRVAGVGVAAVVVLSSVVLRLTGTAVAATASGLSAAELAGALVVVAAVVRRESGRVAAGVVGLVLGGALAARLVRPGHPASATDGEFNAVLLGVALLAGWYLRGRDAGNARRMRAAVRTAQQQERVALARELHDVVAHHIGGMVVQAQAARAVAVPDPGAAARVLPLIEHAGTDALAAMRLMVAVLRGADDGGPATGSVDLTADLNAVTATAAGGVPVRLTVRLPETLPAEVATTVLRLVQESVTNARRYAAGAGEVTATVEAGDGTVRVRVRDDGRHLDGPGNSGGGGFGLLGMRERVHLLGGTFEAGRLPGAGWQVLAEVPLPRAADTRTPG